MNQKGIDPNIKTVKNDYPINTTPSQKENDKLKLLIMDKFNVSSNEAERILLEIKQRKNNDNEKKYNPNQHHFKDNDNQNYSNFQKNRNGISNKQKEGNDFNKNQIKNELVNNKLVSQKSHPSANVDSVIGDILPDYNKQISVEVNHVYLTFEVQNERVDTLKESFIRVLKRDRPKKIKINALNDISFKIYKGEKVGIIGYNGAGKSSLLNLIAGVYPPTKGSVTTYGNISPLLSLGAGFDYNFSGRRNIILNGAVLGYSKEFLQSKIDEIIEFSELGKFIDIPIKNYSSGMLAKLGFSIATAVEPDILIIDEILGVGDVTFKKKSGDKIKSLMDGGTTVLFVSHSIAQVRELCDKAIWIDNGNLREIGEVNKVCDNYLKDSENASNEQLANIQF